MLLKWLPYTAIRPFLFQLDPEKAHTMGLELLRSAHRLRLLPYLAPMFETSPVEFSGIRFEHPVGLAAGLDKNADYLDALGSLGFSFIEVGTVTPKPQLGNAKPRLFRLPCDTAIINRMGFNNKGVKHVRANLERSQYKGVLGINIGKNKQTPTEKSVDDYLYCLRELYPFGDYFTINISSPNTPGLRSLQSKAVLRDLLGPIKEEAQRLSAYWNKKVPLWLKIAPDLEVNELISIGEVVKEFGLDAMILTNTTIERNSVRHALKKEQGGLSGEPLFEPSTQMVRELKEHFGDSIPIVGVGGITTSQKALEKLNAGADLIQLYTGFIYGGWTLLYEILELIIRQKK